MKKRTMHWILLLLTTICLSSCSKDDSEKNIEEEFNAFLQDEMNNQSIPAMSVLVFKGPNILLEKHLGKSNLEQNTALSSDHLFLLASVSKVITATALLQLYDDGLFNLNDSINAYLPFRVSVPNQSTPITFKMLLTHTSAIADGSALDGQYYYGQDSPVELDYFLENYLAINGQFYNSTENFHNFEPGTDYEYSNAANALIGVLVEQISKTDFNTYCKQNIFQPLGLNHTFWRLDESIQSNYPLVQPYDFKNNQFEAIQHYTFTDYPNGGLRSSARDLFTFLSTLAQGGNSKGYQLLESNTVQSMYTPQIPSIKSDEGLHLFQFNAKHNLWGHDGGEQGVATIMAFNPSTKVGAIILTNQGEANLDEILVEAYTLGLEL
jgi:CubicO group peptidase (beta-lactamase class C family)